MQYRIMDGTGIRKYCCRNINCMKIPNVRIHDVRSCIGMLSKSRRQILHVAGTMHVLFHLDTSLTIPPTISEAALKAAQSFVELCNEHTACLGGRGDCGEAIESIQQLRKVLL